MSLVARTTSAATISPPSVATATWALNPWMKPSLAVGVIVLSGSVKLIVASGRGWVATCRGRSLAYFIAAGAAENTSVFMNVFALSIGAVSVVAPLYGAAPIFVLFLSFFFLRGVEVLTARVVTGTVLIVLGIYLISALAGR